MREPEIRTEPLSDAIWTDQTPTDESWTDETRTATTRRAVLVGAAAFGAVALAGCGSSSAGQGSGGDATSTAGSGAAGGTSPSADALATTAEVPVGGGFVAEAQKVVLTQPTAGTYKAFSAVCTHQGCLVKSVQDGVIQCDCHGSQFSATDGSVKRGPATQALSAVNVTVQGDSIVKA